MIFKVQIQKKPHYSCSRERERQHGGQVILKSRRSDARSRVFAREKPWNVIKVKVNKPFGFSAVVKLDTIKSRAREIQFWFDRRLIVTSFPTYGTAAAEDKIDRDLLRVRVPNCIYKAGIEH